MIQIKKYLRGLIIKAFHLEDYKVKYQETEKNLKTFRQAVFQNPASILITDHQGAIVYVNSKFSKISGYQPEEVIGKRPSILKSGATRQEDYKELWNTITSGQEWKGRFKNKKKNGEFYYESAHIIPIKHEDNAIANFLAIQEDVTHQVYSNNLIRTLTKVVEQNPIALIITDAKGEIEFVNSRFTALMKYTPEDLRGKNYEFLDPGLEKDTIEDMQLKLNSKEPWQGEFEFRKKDGTTFWGQAIVAPILNDDDNVTNYLVSMRDISEKKKMISEVIAAKDKAQESDRLKTAIIQNMSHEIRTPLNAISGFSSLLPDAFGNQEKIEKYTGIIVQQSTVLLEIINEILDISRIESGKMTVNLERCDINEILSNLQEFYTDYRKRIKKEHIDFTLYSDPEIRLFSSDAYKLNQILTHILSNALKFTHSGKVELSCGLKGDCLLFTVSDTGIGIPDHKKSEIFKVFHQAFTDISQTYGGTGLGLAIVKGILDLMNGDIWVESEPGKGSRFYFTIPYVPLEE